MLSLVGVGYVPWLVAALALVWIAIAAQLAALAVGRYAPYPDVRARRRERLCAPSLRGLLKPAEHAADLEDVQEAP